VTTVGIVPARGGSKRIPRKNIKDFHGRPLIAHTIGAMLDASVFDRVVVSTDDHEIASISSAAGAEVPFLRPPELADDITGTGAVIRHAIGQLEQDHGEPLDAVCLMYPAAVFVTASDLTNALDALRADPELDYVFSATTFASPIERALEVDHHGRASLLHPEHLLTRSQDLRDRYHDVGQFYWGRRASWMDAVPVLQGRSRVHEIERWRVQDIDTPEDWTRAEMLYELIGHRPR